MSKIKFYLLLILAFGTIITLSALIGYDVYLNNLNIILSILGGLVAMFMLSWFTLFFFWGFSNNE